MPVYISFTKSKGGKKGKKSTKLAIPRLWWLCKSGGKSREKGGKGSLIEEELKSEKVCHKRYSGVLWFLRKIIYNSVKIQLKGSDNNTVKKKIVWLMLVCFIFNFILFPVLALADDLDQGIIQWQGPLPTGSQLKEIYEQNKRKFPMPIFKYLINDSLKEQGLFWITATTRATTSIRYKTIGWQITFYAPEVQGNQRFFYARVKTPVSVDYTEGDTVYSRHNAYLLSNQNPQMAFIDQLLNEYSHSQQYVKIKDKDGKIKTVKASDAILYALSDDSNNWFYIDAIMTVVVNGKQLGKLNSDGTTTGVVFFTGYGTSWYKGKYVTTPYGQNIHPFVNPTKYIIPSKKHPEFVQQVAKDKGIASYTDWKNENTAFVSYYFRAFSYLIPIVDITVKRVYKDLEGKIVGTEISQHQAFINMDGVTKQITEQKEVTYKGKKYRFDKDDDTNIDEDKGVHIDQTKINIEVPSDKKNTTSSFNDLTITLSFDAMYKYTVEVTYYYKQVVTTRHRVILHTVLKTILPNGTIQTDSSVKDLGTEEVPIDKPASKTVSFNLPAGYTLTEAYYLIDTDPTKYKLTTDPSVRSIVVDYKLDDKQNHQYNVWVYATGYRNPDLKGTIVFTPNSSYYIPGNRDGWVNKDINVQVTINGDKEVTKYGSEDRKYKYTVSVCDDWDWVCTEYGEPICLQEDENGNCTSWYRPCVSGYWTCVKSHPETRYGYASCEYKQIWKYKSIEVKGTGSDANGNQIQLPTSYLQDGEYYTISSELDNIRLTGKITDWVSKEKTFICGNPPQGSWDQSTPSTDTEKPTATYDSSSGFYRLDKTKPQYHLADGVSPSINWTNQPYWFEIDATDNLSGFYAQNSYIQVEDRSYLKQDMSDYNMQYFDKFLDDFVYVYFDKDGIYYVKHRIEDYAMNVCSEVEYGPYRIDMTQPDKARFKEEERSGLNQPVVVDVTVSDNLSGIKEVRYVLSHSATPPADIKTTGTVVTNDDGSVFQTQENSNEQRTFKVRVDTPGIWYLHVYQVDRAGNERIDTSYKIIYVPIEVIEKEKTVPRGARFDFEVKLKGIDKQNQQEIQNFVIYVEGPGWINNKIDERDENGNYAVSLDTDIAVFSFWKYENNEAYFYLPVITPYGTPLTYAKDGRKVRDEYIYKVSYTYIGNYEDNGQSTIDDSGQVENPDEDRTEEIASKIYDSTYIDDIRISVAHEMEMKTEIINNEY